MDERKCPDGGACHHQCGPRNESCFRVAFAEPLSGVYPDDRWPDTVRDIESLVGKVTD
jgi:hypothetical protein